MEPTELLGTDFFKFKQILFPTSPNSWTFRQPCMDSFKRYLHDNDQQETVKKALLEFRSSNFFKCLPEWSAVLEKRFLGEDLDDFDDFDDFVEALIEELSDGPFLPAVQTLLLEYGHYLQNNLESVEKALIEYLRLRVKTLIYSQNKPTVIYLSWCFSNNSKMNEILTSAGIYSDLILQSERTAITVC